MSAGPPLDNLCSRNQRSMNSLQTAPLGFSDLTRDECLIVSIFRAWKRARPTHSVAEHSIARLLETDEIYPALDALFAAFASLALAGLAEHGDSDVLVTSEEVLLDQLSTDDESKPSRQAVQACRSALQMARIELRPSRCIERTGHDLDMERIARSYRILGRSPL